MGFTLGQKLIKTHLVSGDMTPGSEVGIRIDQTLTLHIRQIDNVDTVCSMDGNTSASGYKSNYLVSRYRTAAL